MDEQKEKKEPRHLKSGALRWGPIFWRTIHTMAMCYPGRVRETTYKTFYRLLAEMIPCHKCASLYKEKLKTMPLDDYMDDSVHLFSWTVELHNRVNHSLGKPRMDVQEAYRIHK